MYWITWGSNKNLVGIVTKVFTFSLKLWAKTTNSHLIYSNSYEDLKYSLLMICKKIKYFNWLKKKIGKLNFYWTIKTAETIQTKFVRVNTGHISTVLSWQWKAFMENTKNIKWKGEYKKCLPPGLTGSVYLSDLHNSKNIVNWHINLCQGQCALKEFRLRRKTGSSKNILIVLKLIQFK